MRGGEQRRQVGVGADQADLHLVRADCLHLLELLGNGHYLGTELRHLVTVQRVDHIG
ncbi:hypothetical protein D3C84_1234600 [compost metagenome]